MPSLDITGLCKRHSIIYCIEHGYGKDSKAEPYHAVADVLVICH